METQTATSNFELFLKTPKGIEAALRVNVEDIDERGEPQPKLARLVAYMARLDKQLAEAEFQRSDRLDKPVRGGGGRPPSPPPTFVNADGETVEVKCGTCGGAVYDNREENKQRKAEGKTARPDFKCQDRRCEWVQWPPKAAA